MSEEARASDDVVLSIRFQGHRVSHTDIVDMLESVEDSLKEGEVQEVTELCAAFEISPMIRDAVLYRLKESGIQRFYVQAAKPGSLELTAILVAATYFILHKTVIESIKEGYLSSEMHERIKEWVAKQINEKLVHFVQNLRSNWRMQKMHPSVSMDENARLITVVVEDRKTEEELPPTYAQLALPSPQIRDEGNPPKQ